MPCFGIYSLTKKNTPPPEGRGKPEPIYPPLRGGVMYLGVKKYFLQATISAVYTIIFYFF
jgi:hypothetical protein